MKFMMQKKFVSLIAAIILLALLSACTILNNRDRDSSSLTVASIHETVVAGKTSTKELKNLYGKPDRVETDSKKAMDLERKINNDEGSINVALEDNTDYWDTMKVARDSAVLKGRKYDGYYEYRGKGLAGVRVYFFIIDNTVRSYRFSGDITDENIAKKDKYLRETIGA